MHKRRYGRLSALCQAGSRNRAVATGTIDRSSEKWIAQWMSRLMLRNVRVGARQVQQRCKTCPGLVEFGGVGGLVDGPRRQLIPHLVQTLYSRRDQGMCLKQPPDERRWLVLVLKRTLQ